jgi:ApbE superfamily uncharacterized protein (UPF0280 family)
MYRERRYRQASHAPDLYAFEVMVQETDLFIQAERDLSSLARKVVEELRDQLEGYLSFHPEFGTSLLPLAPSPLSPPIAHLMATAASRAGVGPMAAVAGSFAELLGQELFAYSSELIVENGGDIFLRSSRPRVVGVHAGKSPWSDRLGLRVKSQGQPLGICTSAGALGHSFSLGRAEAVVILAPSAALADAVATAAGNRIQRKEDIPETLRWIRSIPGVTGALLIAESELGAWGDFELIDLESEGTLG